MIPADSPRLRVSTASRRANATGPIGGSLVRLAPWQMRTCAGDNGSKVPDGNYFFKATVISQGKTTNPSVNVLSTVTGVNQQADKTVMLEVAGGKSVKLTDVQRIGS